MFFFLHRYYWTLMSILAVVAGLCFGQLVSQGAGLLLTPAPGTRRAPLYAAAPADQGRSLTSYSIVLQNHPFDVSQRGQQTLKDAPVAEKPAVRVPSSVSASVVLVGTVAGGDRPLAVLQVNGKILVLPVGDALEEGSVLEEVQRKRVFLRRPNGSLQELPLSEGTTSTATTASPARRTSKTRFQVKAAGPNRWVIPEAEMVRARDNLGELLKSARMTPNQVNGKTDGFLIQSIRTQSLLSQIGLRRGDIVKEVNGIGLTSPEKALQVFQQLRNARNISLSLVRGNERLTFDYEVN